MRFIEITLDLFFYYDPQIKMSVPRLCEIFECKPPVSLRKHLKGKRVALISKAPSLEGTNLGPEIDRYDVVVRINQAFDFASELHSDYGSRTDVVYDTMNRSSIKLLNAYWDTHTGKELIFVRHNIKYNEVPALEYLRPDIKFRYAHPSILARNFRPLVQTGILAAADILKDSEVSELFIAGFDFYTNKASYTNDAIQKTISVIHEGEALKTAQGRVPHDQRQQAKFFVDFVSSDPRVKLHAGTTQALNARLRN
jgi:hypothetical protein